jgi:Leucine-rich repeat (LRR) protein
MDPENILLNDDKSRQRLLEFVRRYNRGFKPKTWEELFAMTKLNLSFNKLTELPAEIGLLINLTELDLRNNKLTELPAEIGSLIKLIFLYLANNKLMKLPAEIGLLINLTNLNLHNNQLTKLDYTRMCIV